jgi:exodeoxyribonuclease I
MSQTYFFYDLETTGLDPRNDRIMQFAGRRTTIDLEPVGEPYNILVKLNDDILPSPEALLVTGITPQSTQEEGISEAEFARLISEEICIKDTVTIGFNNIRFDDEFIRALLWRNFYDPYEWCWKDGRSRWDMLDVVRMTRALRPNGITWPVVGGGKPTNRLELLTKENGIDHFKAHDALSDVDALIAVTKLIREKQPQLYNYLLSMRDKKKVQQLVNLDDKKPFVYVSGRYENEYHKATIAFPLTTGKNGAIVVYDLRYDPTEFINLSAADLKKRLNAPWAERSKEGFISIPVKELQYNRAPAVAPLGVLEQGDGWKRLGLTKDIIEKHMAILLSRADFAESIRSACEQKPEFTKSSDPEAQLYDGFVNDRDKLRIETVRNADSITLADFHPEFADERLSPLLLHYKARNYPSSLSEDEAMEWETWRSQHITGQLPRFGASLERLMKAETDTNKQYILQELQLWVESILPTDLSNE